MKSDRVFMTMDFKQDGKRLKRGGSILEIDGVRVPIAEDENEFIAIWHDPDVREKRYRERGEFLDSIEAGPVPDAIPAEELPTDIAEFWRLFSEAIASRAHLLAVKMGGHIGVVNGEYVLCLVTNAVDLRVWMKHEDGYIVPDEERMQFFQNGINKTDQVIGSLDKAIAKATSAGDLNSDAKAFVQPGRKPLRVRAKSVEVRNTTVIRN